MDVIRQRAALSVADTQVMLSLQEQNEAAARRAFETGVRPLLIWFREQNLTPDPLLSVILLLRRVHWKQENAEP